MNFAFNEDQDRLRDSAARFLRDCIDLGRLTAQGNRPDTTYDQTLWNEIVALGWTGLIVPEEYGGLGMSLVDWVVITEELGRSLAPCPYLGNYAGTLALLRAGSAEQKETLLPQIIGGTVQTALAWSESEQTEDPLAVTATVRNGRLTGSKRYVFDADTATHLIVTARDATGSLGFYLVERDHGVSIEPVPWMDVTRRVCRDGRESAEGEPEVHFVLSDRPERIVWILGHEALHEPVQVRDVRPPVPGISHECYLLAALQPREQKGAVPDRLTRLRIVHTVAPNLRDVLTRERVARKDERVQVSPSCERLT